MTKTACASMDIELKKYLHDILEAALDIQSFIADKSQLEYVKNRMLKAAVERKFEIIGEALTRISKKDRAMAESISDFRQIISFRNVLIHGYDSIDDVIVWDISQQALNTLLAQVKQLLKQ